MLPITQRLRAAYCAGFVSMALACGAETPSGSGAGSSAASTGAGGDAGGCAPGELPMDGGGCLAAGVPPERCASGFDAKDQGCTPVLPEGICPSGQLAVPGDATCHTIASCAAGTWGDIPVDATTQFVDGSYTGTDSDGSQAKPWATIVEGINAASAGATVAVAAGSYVGMFEVSAKPVRIVGVCPELVELHGPVDAAALAVVNATGTYVGRLAVTGSTGFYITGSQDVLLEQLWIHDTTERAIAAQNDKGPTSVTLRESLVDSATETGILVAGSAVTLDASVVRSTRPRPATHTLGDGIDCLAHPSNGARGSVTASHVVVERNREAGILVSGCDLSLDASVVRDTDVAESDGLRGYGVVAQFDAPTGERSTAVVRSSVLQRNHTHAVDVLSSDVSLEASVLSDTLPMTANQRFGRGANAEPDPEGGGATSLTLRSCLVERNHDAGLTTAGATVTVEATIVRDSLSRALDGAFGIGIGVTEFPTSPPLRSTLTLRGSVVSGNKTIGVFVDGSDATVENVLVRDTAPEENDGAFGRGLGVQSSIQTGERASAIVRDSLVTGSYDTGIYVYGSDFVGQRSRVETVHRQMSDGFDGDGVAIWSEANQPATATIDHLEVQGSERAGLASFGARVALASSTLHCNAINLDGETYDQVPPLFEDGGGNVCGCGSATACSAAMSSLAPPKASPSQ